MCRDTNDPGTKIISLLICFCGVDGGDQHPADRAAVVLQRLLLYLAIHFLPLLSPQPHYTNIVLQFQVIFRLCRSDIFATQKRYCRFAAAILYSPPKLPEGQYHLRSKYNWRSQYNSPKANIAENTVIVVSQLRCFHGGD